MKRLKKSSIVFLALLLTMIANFGITMAAGSTFDFTLVRGVNDKSDPTAKTKYAEYGIVNVLSTSTAGYSTDYSIIGAYSTVPCTDITRIENSRGAYGEMDYDNPYFMGNVRLRGIDGTLLAPAYATVSGYWSPLQTLSQ